MISERDDFQAELAARYAGIWNGNRVAIASNKVVVDPLPAVGESRWGVSAVFRPDLPEAVWDELRKLKLRVGTGHALYGPKNVHVTFRSNEAFRGAVASDDPDVQGYAEALRTTLADAGPLRVAFRGMIAVRNSILLCGYPDFDIIGLRRAYFRQIEDRGLIRPGPEMTIDKVRNTCHASLAVFSGPLLDPVGAAGQFDALRDRDFGAIQLKEFEIVSYRRSPTIIDMVTLATVPCQSP